MNVAGTDVVSIREIADAVGSLLRKTVKYELVAESQDIVADTSKMFDYLPSSQMTPFSIGLEEVVRTLSTDLGH